MGGWVDGWMGGDGVVETRQGRRGRTPPTASRIFIRSVVPIVPIVPCRSLIFHCIDSGVRCTCAGTRRGHARRFPNFDRFIRRSILSHTFVSDAQKTNGASRVVSTMAKKSVGDLSKADLEGKVRVHFSAVVLFSLHRHGCWVRFLDFVCLWGVIDALIRDETFHHWSTGACRTSHVAHRTATRHVNQKFRRAT